MKTETKAKDHLVNNYVCANEEALTQKPEGLSFEQAAAIPQAAVLALQGLRDKGKLLA